MSADDLEHYESDIELALYREYRDVASMFRYVVETERRLYLANEVSKTIKNDGARPYAEIEIRDAWVWDMYRHSRFVTSASIVTFKDVNIEELPTSDQPVLPPDIT